MRNAILKNSLAELVHALLHKAVHGRRVLRDGPVAEHLLLRGLHAVACQNSQCKAHPPLSSFPSSSSSPGSGSTYKAFGLTTMVLLLGSEMLTLLDSVPVS